MPKGSKTHDIFPLVPVSTPNTRLHKQKLHKTIMQNKLCQVMIHINFNTVNHLYH